MLQTALATAAALVALAFTMATFERWLDRRRRHELAWSVALAQFSLASFALAAGAALGWDGATFRAFYLLGAITNVPFLALGTVYLLAGPRAGSRAGLGVVVFAAFAAGVVVAAPFRAPVPVERLPQGSEVFGPLPRALAALASSGGALVVIGGAAWSAWRIRRGRMMWANVVIAAGTLVTGASGLLNSVLGAMAAFAVTLAVGITIIFAGFLMAAAATAAHAGERPAGGATRLRSDGPRGGSPQSTADGLADGIPR